MSNTYKMFENHRPQLSSLELEEIRKEVMKHSSQFDIDKRNFDYLEQLMNAENLALLEEQTIQSERELKRANDLLEEKREALATLQSAALIEQKQLETKLAVDQKLFEEKKRYYEIENNKHLSAVRAGLEAVKKSYIEKRKWSNFVATVKSKLPLLTQDRRGLVTHLPFPETKSELDRNHQEHMAEIIHYIQGKQANFNLRTAQLAATQEYYNHIALVYLVGKMSKSSDPHKELKKAKAEIDRRKRKGEPLTDYLQAVNTLVDLQNQGALFNSYLLSLVKNKKLNLTQGQIQKVNALQHILLNEKNYEKMCTDLKKLREKLQAERKSSSDTSSLDFLMLEPATKSSLSPGGHYRIEDESKLEEAMDERTKAYHDYQVKLASKEYALYMTHDDIRLQKIKENKKEDPRYTYEEKAEINLGLTELVQKAVQGDKTPLESKLELYSEVGVLTQQEVAHIQLHIAALDKNKFAATAVLTTTQQQHVTDLDRLMERATTADELIHEAKRFTYSSSVGLSRFTKSDKDSLDEAVRQEAETQSKLPQADLSPLETELRQLHEKITKLQSDLQSVERGGPSVEERKLTAAITTVLAEVQTKQTKLDLAKAVKARAESEPKYQEDRLARTYALQLMVAVDTYVNVKKSWYHTKNGIKDANNLKDALTRLLRNESVSIKQVNDLFSPLLKKSRLRNRSYASIALEVLYNDGTPKGLFRLALHPEIEQKDLRGVEYVRQVLLSSGGCADPNTTYHTTGAEIGKLKIPTTEVTWQGRVKSLISRGRQLWTNHRTLIRERAEKNLVKLEKAFISLHPEQQARRERGLVI